MTTNRPNDWLRFLLLLLAGAGWSLLGPQATAELVLQRLYTSPLGQPAVGISALTQGTDGNFYGTTPANNLGDYGSLFRLTPAGVMAKLVTFTGFNGRDPEAGLLLATDGNLYGTTMQGGTYGLGTLFKLTSTGHFQVLHSFNGADGAGPIYTLIQARNGLLYGVTMTGRTNPATVFQATTAGTITTLTNLSLSSPPYTTPMNPSDGLVEGPDGWLYGTTTFSSLRSTLIGSIYKVSTNGTRKILATFADPSGTPWPGSGDHPIGGLTAGTDGFLYGTIGHAYSPGATNNGSVFRMTTDGVRTTLAFFNRTDGANPMTRLLLANDGCFYGITTEGGPNNKGMLFRFTTNGVLTTLGDGVGAYGVQSGPSPLLQALDGNLYGTGLIAAGANASSVIFRLVPAPVLAAGNLSGGRLTLAWTSFTSGVYRVDCKNSLNDVAWATLTSSITATGSTASVSDTLGSTQRFYRVRLLP